MPLGKLLFVATTLCFCTGLVFSQNNFTLSGTLPPGYAGLSVTLYSSDHVFENIELDDQKEAFVFNAEMSREFEPVSLGIKKDGQTLGWWNFFIKPGSMKVDVLTLRDRGQQDMRYTAIPFTEKLETHEARIKPLDDSLAELENFIRSHQKIYPGRYDDDSLKALRAYLWAERTSRQIAFVQENTASYIGLHFFNKEVVGEGHSSLVQADSLMTLYNAFDSSLKETVLGRAVYSYIKSKQLLTVGNPAPDFAFLAADGQSYSLSTFLHKKYILMCFWGYGCAPCMRNIPFLKELKSKYESRGLQLISCALNSNEQWWLQSLKKYGLDWIQTCDLAPYRQGNSVRRLFDVNSMPQYFLIDLDGKLVYHNVQMQDGDTYEKLQQLLKETLD